MSVSAEACRLLVPDLNTDIVIILLPIAVVMRVSVYFVSCSEDESVHAVNK